MATNIQTAWILKSTWDSDAVIVDTTAGQEPDATLAAGTYIAIAGLWEEVVVAAPAAFTSGQWSVAGNATEGELVFTISALPLRNGSKIDKFQYAVDADGTPTWTDLPAGTTTGTYTATGVTDGTYTSTIGIRAVTSAGNGAVSDLKTATVAGGTVNLITNGTFDSATGWGLTGTGLSITGGKLTFAGVTSGGRATQDFAGGELAAGNYNWSFDVTNSNGNGTDIKLIFRDASAVVAQTADIEMSNGAKSNTITFASPVTQIRVQSTSGSPGVTAELDNLIVTAA
jgi:hypothetical protein